MKNRTPLIVLFLIGIFPTLSVASLSLTPIYGDHMVIQQGESFLLWGETTPREIVGVEMAGRRLETLADEFGSWELEMPALEVGGPYDLRVRSGDQLIEVSDILVGEVWFCSGQSNMEWTLANSNDLEENLKMADNPQLRLFKVARKTAFEEKKHIQGRWELSTTETARTFSAIGWMFGNKLQRDKDIPVGLIDSTWGGTPIEAWSSQEVLKAFPFMEKQLADWNRLIQLQGEVKEPEALKAYFEDRKYLEDRGDFGSLMGWSLSGFDHSDWPTMRLPTLIENQGLRINGAVWFRKTIILPEHWQGKELQLNLGRIDDFDTTFANAVMVGATGDEFLDARAERRRYVIPEEVTAAGEEKLTLAVRVFDRYHQGGFRGPQDELYLQLGDNEAERIDLKGAWFYQVESSTVDPESGSLGALFQSQSRKPSILFNAMIAPLVDFPVRGFLWYQGEGNAGRPDEYAELFPAMIANWRDLWGGEDRPFFYVQLANFQAEQKQPVEKGWAYIREAQQAALKLPNVEEALTIDVGDARDIHPRDKKTPAMRLYRHAEATVYGKDIPHRHPRLSSWKVEAGSIWIDIGFVEGELKTRDGKAVGGFAIRGADGPWLWADVELVDWDTLRVYHPELDQPKAVRYNWANNPIGNLIDSRGLPLSQFRTDGPDE